ncbi:hypothetical protein KHC28_04475 [Ancylobacter sonchi]|uniref:hypothetical protein n=1 Tax=Ancylobacter sonchi TaxID=1937790 RepID=UPI001BD2CFCF|nr:hypothetical protein [Ancylobacter sonchi]MBS7532910.1 hypothetical protein [Ancylobacter sonchi]
MSESWSAQDYRAGLEGWTHYQPTSPVEFARGVADREGRVPFLGGGGGGGNGGFIAIPVILMAPVILIVGLFILVPLFPIAGGIAAIAGYLLQTFIFNDPTMQGVANDSVTMLFCFIVLMLAMKLERQAEGHFRYRQFRHWARVVGLAFGINEAILPLISLYIGGRQAAYGWGMTGDFHMMALLRFIALMVAIHVFLRWKRTGRTAMSPAQRFGFAEPY